MSNQPVSPNAPHSPNSHIGQFGNSNYNPIQPHDTYNLQGVIRYLQLEWSRAEEQRINWQNDRAELKSVIGKLTGEIRSLKEINRKLQDEVDFYKEKEGTLDKKGKLNLFDVKEDFTLKLNEPNINPLVRAKLYLKSKKEEIDYLLKDGVKPVNEVLAIHKRHVLSLDSTPLPPAAQTSQVVVSVPSVSDSSSSQIVNQNQSIPQETSKSVTNLTPEIQDETEESIMSDAETIIDNEEESPATSPSVQSEEDVEGKKKDNAEDVEEEKTKEDTYTSNLVAELSSHLSEITELSLNNDTLLSASKDGMIKIWDLLQMHQQQNQEIAQLSPKKTIYGRTPLKFMKWVNDKFFIILTLDNVVKCYNAKNYKNVVELKLEGNVLSVDVCEIGMAVLFEGEGGVKWFSITINDDNLNIKDATPLTFKNISNDFSLVKIDANDKNKFYGYSKSESFFEEFNWKTGQTNSLLFKEELVSNLSDFKIFSNQTWLFLSPTSFKLYKKQSKKTIYSLITPDPQLSDVDFNPSTRQLLLYHNNGQINIHSFNPNSQKYSISKSFNHYDSVLSDGKFDDLNSQERKVLSHCWSVGLVYGKNYCLAAAGDCFIRIFKI